MPDSRHQRLIKETNSLFLTHWLCLSGVQQSHNSFIKAQKPLHYSSRKVNNEDGMTVKTKTKVKKSFF